MICYSEEHHCLLWSGEPSQPLQIIYYRFSSKQLLFKKKLMFHLSGICTQCQSQAYCYKKLVPTLRLLYYTHYLNFVLKHGQDILSFPNMSKRCIPF